MVRKKLRYWLVLTAVMAMVLAYAGHRNLRQRFQDYLKNKGEIQAKLRECEALEQRIQASRERVTSLGSDPLEIEAEIRRNKNLVREGEKIYRIQTVSEDPASQDDPEDAGR
jgi:cell division protein FtsB